MRLAPLLALFGFLGACDGDAPKPPDDPGDTDPGDTDPGDTDPGDTDPSDTDPGDTDPGDTDPGDTDPGDTGPDDTDPGDTDSGDTDSGDTDPGDTDTADADGDGDGVPAGEDCDDADADVFPGADERCNDRDDDCDGTTDPDTSADASTWHADADGDTYGDPAVSTLACAAPADHVADATDCDDTRADVHPGAAERCNDADDDCDGAIDPAASADASTWHADADGDTYGDPAVSTLACDAPAAHVADATDCDDGDADIHPGAAERCNDADDDCDGAVDPDTSLDASPWYADADADGWGSGDATVACTAPTGSVAAGGDCDDTDATVNPAAAEICDGRDDDCDGAVDNDAIDGLDAYVDADGDGYGDSASPTRACVLGEGFATVDTDCDDADDAIHPAAAELCWNGVDDDCDGFDTGDTDCAPAGSSPSVSMRVTIASSNVSAMAFVPDIGMNGHDDFAVGMSSGAGTVWIFDGILGDGGAADSTEDDVELLGISASDGFGAAIVGLDDLDGTDSDGFAVGAAGVDTGGSNAGAVYVFASDAGLYGSNTASVADAVLRGYAASDATGSALAAPGDLDGDGVDDLLIGAAGNDIGGSAAGAVWIVFGGTGSHTLDPGTDGVIVGEMASDALATCAGLGDIDGDGHADLAVSAAANDDAGTAAGKVYVHRGPFDARRYEAGAASLRIVGDGANDAFGTAIAGAGDVDADGHPDLLVSAPGDDDGSFSNVGVVSLFHGPLPRGYMAAADADVRIFGDASSDAVSAVAGGADVDGDGWDDLLVGAIGADLLGSGDGGAFLFYGPLAEGDLALSDADALLADTTGSGAGARVALGGDLDSDGYADLAFTSGGAMYGVHLHTGGSRAEDVAEPGDPGVDDDLDGWTEDDGDCDDARAARAPDLTESCGTGGDEDCDDRADRCAPAAVSTLTSLRPLVASGSTTYGYLGELVRVVGDLNGDGVDDVAAADYYYGTRIGRFYAWFGPIPEESLSDSTADLILTGSRAEDLVGQSFAPAGDLDADGFDDLVLDGEIYRGGPELQGTRTATSPDWTFAGGTVAETVGDLNGDGYDDLVVVYTSDGPTLSRYYAGVVALYLGPLAPGAYTGFDAADATWIGDIEGHDLGGQLRAVGDIDGDGLHELALRADARAYAVADRETSSTHAGAIAVWSSPVALPAEAQAQTADLWLMSDADGVDAWAIGDIDGDGLGELVAGADGGDFVIVPLAGLRGSPVLEDEAVATIAADSTGWAHVSVAIGDVDRDGYGDVVLGGLVDSATGTDGGVWIFRGPLLGAYALTDADYIVEGAGGVGLGQSVDVGDLDGDGFVDVVAGMRDYGGVYKPGGLVVLYGGWVTGTDEHTPTAGDPTVDADGDGYTADTGDCNDARADLSPAGVEVCGGAVDEDCDGHALACAPVGTVYLQAPLPRVLGTFSVAGDLDGDGLSDLIGYDSADDAAYLLYAPFHAGTLDGTEAEDVVWSGTSATGEPDGGRGSAGDWDGDGIGEIAVAVGANPAVFVFASAGGYTSSTLAEATWVFEGVGASDEFGELLVDAGDLDGDGIGALAISAHEASGGYGAVYLFAGDLAAGTWDTGDAETVFTGPTATTLAEVGSRVVALGDIDGDGVDDLALGDDRFSAADADVTYIWLGDGTTGAFSVTDAPIQVTRGTGDGASQPAVVAAVGDVDGDGTADFALAQPDWHDWRITLSGKVFVWSGAPPSGVSAATDADLTIEGYSSRAELGKAVSAAYDLDGDGFDDLLAIEPDTYTTGYGRVYAWYGPVGMGGTIASATADAVIEGTWDMELSGALQPASDLDQDGYEDLWIGGLLWRGGPQP